MTPEIKDFKSALHDAVSEMAAYLSQQGYYLEVSADWPNDPVLVHPPYIARIMNNISSNIERYADKVNPVLVSVMKTGPVIGVIVANRTDRKRSRNHGAGVGLSNVRSMMNQMGGSSYIEERGRIFALHLWFRIAESENRNLEAEVNETG